jgi:NAD(P)-dependent dehydrogenase (short-subunit alcohol dehydrogenase family)
MADEQRNIHETERTRMSAQPVALVTGARRGIGKATALALAGAGFRVVVTSSRAAPAEDGSASNTGSGLEHTVAAIQALGAEALALPMNLLDRGSIDRLVDTALARWGRIDALVNNAIYQGDDINRTVMQSDPGMLERVFLGQVVNTTYLSQRVIAAALGRHPLSVVNVGSAGGRSDRAQPRPVGQGGTSFAYSASKSALHKLAPMLHCELAGEGLRAFTLNPGVVQTEALEQHFGIVPGAHPVEMPAAVIRWLITAPEADALAGIYLDASEVYAAHAGVASMQDR